MPHLIALWAHFSRHNVGLSVTLTYLHLGGILLGGGLAIATDRASLRLSPATAPDWPQELTRLASAHRWVLAGLVLIFASGLLMMLTSFETFAVSTVFWIKMG